MKFNTSFFLIFTLLCSFGCSESLDFDQANTYLAKPVFNTSLAYFTIDSSNFITIAGAPIITEITETADFKLFEERFIQENLVRLDFEFEIKNEFNRDFTIEISLLDAEDNLIFKLDDLNVSANNLNFKQTIVIDINANPEVKNFTRVQTTISLDDRTTPILASDAGKIVVKSGAIAYLETTL